MTSQEIGSWGGPMIERSRDLHEDVFNRSDPPFFQHDATNETILSLASKSALVIYCGAGVTYDRTGLSWANLITTLLRRVVRDEDGDELGGTGHYDDLTDEDLDILRDKLEPLQLASILGEISTERAGHVRRTQAFMVSRIHTLLYKSSGWQSGALVRNIIRLAVGCAMLGKRVVIITTNFDDYLETEFDEYCRGIRGRRRRAGEPAPLLPGLLVTVLGQARPLSNRLPSMAGLPQLEIVHLHGRVDSDGKSTSRLILTERDYHASHGEVTKLLRELFNIDGAGVLILGSSFTDPPLLAALAATNRKKYRYALISAVATRMTLTPPSQYARLLSAFRHRGMHYGVTFLMPDFHYQVAQFCEELLIAVGLDDPSTYAQGDSRVQYSKRLAAWWDRWKVIDEDRSTAETHRLLYESLRNIKKTLVEHRGPGRRGSDELTKIELWVREDPRRWRRLALWACSAGVLADRRILRTEELVLSSKNASVRAFLEGQPQYVAQENLCGEPGSGTPSRWRSFLSIPVRVDYSCDDSLVGLPVGVITLATMERRGESGIPHRSTADMEDLVRLLLVLGQTLLQA